MKSYKLIFSYGILDMLSLSINILLPSISNSDISKFWKNKHLFINQFFKSSVLIEERNLNLFDLFLNNLNSRS